MKTSRFTQLVSVAFSLAAFSTTGCAKEDKVVTTTAPAAPAPSTTVAVVAVDPDVTFGRWSDIKDCTFDSRATFIAGLARLEARVDAEVGELTAKRAAMLSTANTKDWDFAMKEMHDARAYLKDMGDESRKATPDTWSQAKDKVGLAWVRTQEAYGKVKASTTS